MKLTKISKGGIIYFEDKPDNKVYVIRSGKIELRKKDGYYLIDDTLKNNMLLREGDVFGFEELCVKGILRDQRAVAMEDAEILFFEFEEFASVLKNSISIGEKILNSLSKRVRMLNERIKGVCMIEKDETISESSSDMTDIFYYFVRTSEFKKAMDVLVRMLDVEDHKEFAAKEIKRLEFIQQPGITISRIDDIVRMFSNDEREMLIYVLEGIRVRVEDPEILEKMTYERLRLIKQLNMENTYFDEAEEFVTTNIDSIYAKPVLFTLMNDYEEIGLYPQALNVVNILLNTGLEGSEISIVQSFVDKIQENIG